MTSPETSKGRRLAQLRSHPAPRFVVVGGISLAADVGTLALLHGVLAMALVPATTIAFGVSSVVNFWFNRQWVFARGRSGAARRQLVRYYLLLGLNLLSTLLITVGLTALGMLYLLAKLIASVGNAVVNYCLCRGWVFK